MPFLDLEAHTSSPPLPTDPALQPPRLLDLVRQVALARFGQDGPAQRCAHWTRRFILFHGKRHPCDLGLPEISQFLASIAHTDKNPLRALSAGRDFLYRQLLHLDLGELPLLRPPRLLTEVGRWRFAPMPRMS